MQDIIDYLESEYEDLYRKKNIIEDSIKKVDIKIDKINSMIRDINSTDSSDMFSASSRYYDDKDFNESEVKLLSQEVEALRKEKSTLSYEADNVNERLNNLNVIIDTSYNYKSQYTNCLDFNSKEKVASELKDITRSLELCKKIAVSDSNRVVIELDKTIKTIEKVNKLLI